MTWRVRHFTARRGCNYDDTMTQDRVFFDAVLTPNRSLSPRGFLILMCAIGAVSFVAGVVFFVVGAWPVVGFLGLDVLLIFVAFKINFRHASVVESLRLTRDHLVVERVNHWGQKRTWEFTPAWLQVLVEDSAPRRGLVLRSHGESLAIGRFLTREELQDLADALRQALARASAPCKPQPV